MSKPICQKPVHYLSAQMAVLCSFFQMFIVLGMYNFDHITSTYISKLACLSSRFREGQIELRHWQKGIRGAWRGWYGGRRRRVLPDLASQHFTHAPIFRGPVVPIWTTFHVSIPTLNYLATPQLSLHNWMKLFLKQQSTACWNPNWKKLQLPEQWVPQHKNSCSVTCDFTQSVPRCVGNRSYFHPANKFSRFLYKP